MGTTTDEAAPGFGLGVFVVDLADVRTERLRTATGFRRLELAVADGFVGFFGLARMLWIVSSEWR